MSILHYKFTDFTKDIIKKIDKASNSRTIRQHMLTDANSVAPYLTGRMINSSYLNEDGHIVYDTPYARRQYYEHKTKSYWIERSIFANLYKYEHEMITEIGI